MYSEENKTSEFLKDMSIVKDIVMYFFFFNLSKWI